MGLRAVSALLALSSGGEAAKLKAVGQSDAVNPAAGNLRAAPATATQGGSPEDALSYLQKRFEAVRAEASTLRKQLVQAVKWGHDLEGQVAKTKQHEADEVEHMNGALAAQERDSSAAIAAEQQKESELAEKLEGEERQVKQRDESVATLDNEVNSVNADLQAKENEWHKKEGDLANEVMLLKSQAESREESIKELQDAKAAEDRQIAIMKQRERQISKLKHEVQEAEERERGLKDALNQQSESAAAQMDHLTSDLKLEQRKAREAEINAKRNRQFMVRSAAIAKAQLENTTVRLRNALRAQEALNQDNSMLSWRLEGNASRIRSLEAEVAALQKHMSEEEGARSKAEEMARKSQEALASAQAVAKQLSGAVPQLLEQARLAHEARDAEKAMRAQSQAKAKQQLQTLEDQYADAVRSELDTIQKPLDAAATDAAPANASGSHSGGGAAVADVDLDTGDDDTSAPASADASDSGSSPGDDDDAPAEGGAHRLDKDSDGLGSFIASPPASAADAPYA